jgi:hypothetical protein
LCGVPTAQNVLHFVGEKLDGRVEVFARIPSAPAALLSARCTEDAGLPGTSGPHA